MDSQVVEARASKEYTLKAVQYASQVKPDNITQSDDLTKLITESGMTEIGMVKTGENFFSSLGFAPLPNTFYERSQCVRPRDRDVVCHASAWNLDNKDDLRLKMCIQKNAEDFQTVHHELGHNYYQRAYNKQPYLFQGSANDGFHEAILIHYPIVATHRIHATF